MTEIPLVRKLIACLDYFFYHLLGRVKISDRCGFYIRFAQSDINTMPLTNPWVVFGKQKSKLRELKRDGIMRLNNFTVRRGICKQTGRNIHGNSDAFRLINGGENLRK